MGDIEMINLYTLSAVASFFILRLIIIRLRKPAAGKKNPPPSPPKLPIIGNLHQLGSLPHHTLHSMAGKHGPLMLIHLGSVPVLVVSSAEAVREIMTTHDITFSDRAQYKAFKKLLYDCKNLTFSPYGEYWRQVKSIFVVHLLSKKRVRSFRRIREEETAILVKRIGESGGPVNLCELFNEFTNDLICRSAFGSKYRESEKGRKLLSLLVELMELLGSISVEDFIPWLGWIDRVRGNDQKLDRVRREMDEFLEDVIAERIRNPKENYGENFIDILLHLRNGDGSEASIGMESIKALIIDVIAGGTDTISTVLEWIMTELLRHPEVMEKLQNEVRDIVKDKRDITDDDLSQMHYLKAVIKETLRYHPPGPISIPKRVRKDVKVKGYDIARGTVVMINVWAIGRDRASWDEQEKFEPERFIDSSVDFKGLDFELIPFGAGRRCCPGMTFGIATIELLIANLVQKFNWKLDNEVDGRNLDISERPGLTFRKAFPLIAVAVKATSFNFKIVESRSCI